MLMLDSYFVLYHKCTPSNFCVGSHVYFFIGPYYVKVMLILSPIRSSDTTYTENALTQDANLKGSLSFSKAFVSEQQSAESLQEIEFCQRKSQNGYEGFL